MADAQAPKTPEEEQDERAKANAEAEKIVRTPKEAAQEDVTDVLRETRPLFFEKGLTFLWQRLDDATGNLASKPDVPDIPTKEAEHEPKGGHKPTKAQPISNP